MTPAAGDLECLVMPSLEDSTLVHRPPPRRPWDTRPSVRTAQVGTQSAPASAGALSFGKTSFPNRPPNASTVAAYDGRYRGAVGGDFEHAAHREQSTMMTAGWQCDLAHVHAFDVFRMSSYSG